MDRGSPPPEDIDDATEEVALGMDPLSLEEATPSVTPPAASAPVFSPSMTPTSPAKPPASSLEEDIFGKDEEDEMFPDAPAEVITFDTEPEQEPLAPKVVELPSPNTVDPPSPVPAELPSPKAVAPPVVTAQAPVEPVQAKKKPPPVKAKDVEMDVEKEDETSTSPMSSHVVRPGDDGNTFTISISDPKRVGEGMSSYISFPITAKTSLASYKQPEMHIDRRFSDFHTLYQWLIAKYKSIIVPPCPPKDAINNSFMKFKNEGNEITEFVLHRRAALERFLQRVVDHPILRNDEYLHTFLESDAKLPKPKTEFIDKGMSFISAKLGHYEEAEQWFSERAQELDVLESMLKKLHSAIQGIVASRKELTQCGTKFAESFGALANAEDSASLTAAMYQLADVEHKIAKLHLKQAERDDYNFLEIFADYRGLLRAIHMCMENRVACFRESQSAVSNLASKQSNELKLKAQGKVDKYDQAQREVADAERRVVDTKKAFDTFSKDFRGELERFDFFKIHDFQRTVVSYVESMMVLEQQTIRAYEAYLPEAKGIA